jgi:Arc/MetJ-type ribon-helix-helix transcriptional regulator
VLDKIIGDLWFGRWLSSAREWFIELAYVAGPGMMFGMTRAKIAVTIPKPLLSAARRAVKEGRADSVSAYVTDALREKAKLDDLAAMLDEMLAETGGPPTKHERREAERMLGLRSRRTSAA